MKTREDLYTTSVINYRNQLEELEETIDHNLTLALKDVELKDWKNISEFIIKPIRIDISGYSRSVINSVVGKYKQKTDWKINEYKGWLVFT